jgi:hypothetical protein
MYLHGGKYFYLDKKWDHNVLGRLRRLFKTNREHD